MIRGGGGGFMWSAGGLRDHCRAWRRRFHRHPSRSSGEGGSAVLVSAAIAVVMVFANLALPHRVRLIGVAVLLVPQLYLPGLPASLAMLWTSLTCFAGLIERGRSRADSPLVVISGLIVAATAVSLLWALPSGIRLGVVTGMSVVVFLLWLLERFVR